MANFSAEAAAPATFKSSTDLLTERRLRSQHARDNAHLSTLDARTLFQVLRPRLLNSRPVIGKNRGPYKLDKTGRKRYLHEATPIYGAPTFRNVILMNGEHV